MSRQYDIKTHSRQSSVTLKGKCCSVRGMQLFVECYHGSQPTPMLNYHLQEQLSNIQEGMYWNNNSILSLAEKIWRGEFIELHELLPSRLTTPEPTVLNLLLSWEKSMPKKTISTIQEWATCSPCQQNFKHYRLSILVRIMLE